MGARKSSVEIWALVAPAPGFSLCYITFPAFESRKEIMGNRPAAYWILVLLAVAAMAGAFMMRSSTDPHTHMIVDWLRYGGVALIFIAIIFFRGKPQQTPPMPKD